MAHLHLAPSSSTPHNRRDLPAEILNNIVRYMTDTKDLANFALCNSVAYSAAQPELWLNDIRTTARMPVLYRAILNNDLVVAKKALDAYHGLRIHCPAEVNDILNGSRSELVTTGIPSLPPALSNLQQQQQHQQPLLPASPVMLAVRLGNMDMLRLVVTHPAGCDLDARRRGRIGANRRGACHARCGLSRHNLVDLERVPGAEAPFWEAQAPFAAFPGCESALHWAVRARRPDMLAFLIGSGATAGLGLAGPASRIWTGTSTGCSMDSLVEVIVRKAARVRGTKRGFLELPELHMLALLQDYEAASISVPGRGWRSTKNAVICDGREELEDDEV